MYNSIKILSKKLVNKIAAGEIIERPASVVKELVENSLDAGAIYIFIDIELSGTKSIRISDDGCGIRKNELLLALTSHATSKIYTIDDLDTINSMGFRGEALSSISSVSRFILTSRTIDQKEAWQAYVEGSDMVFNLKPAAHPVGTTVEVLDLFFNIPARRKFMCTIKNEFFYIDKVIRSIALSRFDVTFILQHNKKIVRKYLAVNNNKKEENLRRLSNICSKEFVNRAIEVYFKDKDLFIHGWLENPNIGEVDCNIKYIYINNRIIIFDRVINNAIRQVYSERLIVKKKPAFVLFLDLDPYQVDINVHPKKDNIIFRQKRKVYDFVYCAVSNILNKNLSQKNKIFKIEKDTISYKKWIEKNDINKNNNIIDYKFEKKIINEICLDNKNIVNSYYSSMIKNVEDRNELCSDKFKYFYIKNKIKTNIKLLTIYKQYYALIEYLYGDILLLSLPFADNYLKQQQLIPENGKSLYAYPILIPYRITIDSKQLESIKNNKNLLNDMGIILQLYNDKVIIKAVPLPLYDQNLIELIPELLFYMNNKLCLTYQQIAVWLIKKIKFKFKWSFSQAIKLLSDIEMFSPQFFTKKNNNFLFIFNLKEAIKTINNEL